MSLTLDTKIKEIRENPEAVALINEIVPGFATDPKMKLVAGTTFRKLSQIKQAGVTPEKLEAIEKALASLG